MNSDFLENRKKMINEMSDSDREQMMKEFEMPSMENLLKLVDTLGGVTDEDKEKLREHFLKRAADGQNPFGGAPPGLSNAIPYERSSFELIVFVTMITLIVCVFGKL